MNHSEQINEIAAALCKFQAEVPNPRKTAKVSAGYTDRNGKYQKKEYMYSPLDDIITGIKPYLAKNGLSFIQNPHTSDTAKVTTLLMHSSGQWLESEVTEIKPNDTKPQSVGSALTYARRYSLCAMLGIASEEDDDAEVAQTDGAVSQHEQPNTQPQSQPSNTVSEAQAKAIHAKANELAKLMNTTKDSIFNSLAHENYLGPFQSVETLDKQRGSKAIKTLDELIKQQKANQQ